MNKHPFYTATYNGIDCYATATSCRLLMLQRFDAEQCKAALEVEGLQKTVRTALERRLRKLAKGAA